MKVDFDFYYRPNYLGARDYDPTIGRWTTKDPIGFAGGDTNLYAYVGGNPMSYIDSTGLKIYDDGNLVPEWIKKTDFYKKLDALTDVFITFESASLANGTLGKTVSWPGGHHQTISIDVCQHDPNKKSANNSKLSDYEDTILHELYHANKNLSRGFTTDADTAQDHLEIPNFIKGFSK